MRKVHHVLVILLLSATIMGQTLGGNGKIGGGARASRKPRPGGVLEVTGNSLPRAFAMDGTDWGNLGAVLGRQFDAAYGPGLVTWYNDSYTGQTTEQMIQGILAPITGHYAPGKNNVLVAWEVINSRLLTTPHDSVTQAVDLMKTYCADRKAEGWYVATVTMTATPFDSVELPDFPEWELTDRFTADALMRADPLGDHWDALADLAADPLIAANIQVHGAQQTHPENFLKDGNGNPDIHFDRPGEPYAAKAIFPLITRAFGFPDPTPASLLPKLKAVYPLWNVVPPNVTNTAPDYWGNNMMDLSANVTQNATGISFASAGGGDAHSIPPSHTLHAASAFAVAVRIMPTDIGRDGDQNVVGVWGADGEREYLAHIPNGTNQLVFTTSDDGTIANSHSVTSTVTLQNNTAYSLLIGYDGSNIYISVNNETPVATPVTTIKSNSTSVFKLGNGDPGKMFKGDVSWVIWLTGWPDATERTYLHNDGAARTRLFGPHGNRAWF